ncbi:lipid kinase YegS [Stutzerimonas stutzeri]|jgi:lipid kinase YegS|uniref:Probable lipid kinase YegS-like n=1 Tax=Stutzerimonas stutzeri RCH2 TaxID=644801 RepID=L0GKR8_STUST|nr:lipid kinase YegS [Stutzerimonas stutzeri]AGA86387.1 lipid kinase YegS [Stutzerimonas stutzeri RCH2]OCX93009.1 MAG: lipid kinase YegS [Pseudomonas sp. CO183]
MSDAKALLILHGKQALNDEVREAVRQQRDYGWDLAVRVTWEPGDAQRLVAEALDAGYSKLVAGGGDGTLREVAEAMLQAQAQASLALMPLGSANDFAKAAGIPLDPFEALGLLDEPARWVDVGEMNGQPFVNMATGGFGSKVTASTSEDLKRVLGGGAYLLTGLTRFAEIHSARGRFTGPGFDWEGEFLALGIGNGRQAGGGQLLCPQAKIDDGLLDVCIVPAPADAVGTLGTLLSGGLLGVDAVSVSARVPWLEVEAPSAIDINLDGEPSTAAHLRFDVRAGALRLHLPADCPLLGPASSAP